jgi:hypothetical protein
MEELRKEQESFSGGVDTADTDSSSSHPTGEKHPTGEEQNRLFREQMEQLKEEREEIFGFTDQDHAAWGNASGHKHEASLLERIEAARQGAPSEDDAAFEAEEESTPASIIEPLELTHLTKDRKSVQMVDVGSKEVTQRRAVAQSKVVFPPEVVKAFQPGWRSSKGPIFETAIIAGIMAAK